MLEEIRKSINSNLYERTRSPLYGTFILSWCVWNWKVIYYVLAVDTKTPVFERFDCIQNELTSRWTLIWGPLLSTVFILIVFEFLANYAYWLHLYYKTWRTNKKFKTEGKQLLSYEQSLRLRSEIRKKEEQYEELIQEKEGKIKELEDQIKTIDLDKGSNDDSGNDSMAFEREKINIIYKKLEDQDQLNEFMDVCKRILDGKLFGSSELGAFSFVHLGLLRRVGDPIAGVRLEMTPEGKKVYDKILFS